MSVKLQFKRGLSTDWTNKNPILDVGEPGFEIDTGKLKIGDGRTHWSNLSYISSTGGATQLNDLTDVNISSPTNGQILQYDGSSWVNSNNVFRPNMSNEINNLTEKTSVHDNDIILIEDYEDGYNKKKVKKSLLGSSGIYETLALFN